MVHVYFFVINLSHLYYYCFFLGYTVEKNVCVKEVALNKEPDDYQLKKVKKEEDTQDTTIQNHGKKQKKENRKWCMRFFCVVNLTHLYYSCFFLDDMKENVCVNVKNVAVKTEKDDVYQHKKVKKEEDTIQNLSIIETNMTMASGVPMKDHHGKKQKKSFHCKIAVTNIVSLSFMFRKKVL